MHRTDPTALDSSPSRAWLGESEMARRVIGFDWAATPLGPLQSWPQPLRSAVAICLRSRFQMAVYWGAELNCIYNDAERSILGNRHPAALGRPARELLRDSWEVIGPQLESVMERGEATWAEDRPLALDRRGMREVGFFTYSYSPIVDDDGGVGGVLLVTQDTTARVLAERRIEALRRLATRSAEAADEREACELAARALAGTPDAVFCAIYRTGEDAARAAREVVVGVPSASGSRRLRSELDGEQLGSLSLTPLRGKLVDTRMFVEGGSARDPLPRRSFVTLITAGASDAVAGVMLAGLADDVVFDDAYRTFFEMAAIGVGRSIATARRRSDERERTRSIAALEQAKTALFSDASHELRTPLALVLGHLEQVLEEPELPGRSRESLLAARRSAVRMTKLVGGLLDFSRLESGERVGSFRPTDLAQLTSALAAMFGSTIERAGLRLVVDCPPLSAPAWVDREAWERIVSNLVSNAVKFTPTGRIEVRLREGKGSARLTVRDTGIGIDPADVERIFSRFHRISDPRARTHEGTGIGLALVRELVGLHGGSVEARSRPDEGTEMVVEVPLGSERLAGAVGPADDQGNGVGELTSMFVSEADGWLLGEERPPSPGPPSPPAPSPRAPSRRPPSPGPTGDGRPLDRVLVVEDNADMRGYLRHLLGSRYEVQIAPDGLQACELAIADPPRAVISDVMLAGLDGFGLVRALRQTPRTRDLPVMLVTALADDRSAERAFRLGADDYIVKPFSARELLARVDATIEASRARSEAAAARGRADERGRAQRELRALLNDLRAAQRRVVMAGDAERRKIERDLHDGAQQRLMAIRLELGLLADTAEREPAAARERLETLRRELDDALEDLRELAHGLSPPLLVSDGLHAALSAAARRASIPVSVELPQLDRVPLPVESAAYFCCIEALQNATKHAGEKARATIRLGLRDGLLEFRVTDDGAGFDPGAHPAGHGLTNLHDRVEALGGHAEVVSVPGAGTSVLGQIPIS